MKGQMFKTKTMQKVNHHQINQKTVILIVIGNPIKTTDMLNNEFLKRLTYSILHLFLFKAPSTVFRATVTFDRLGSRGHSITKSNFCSLFNRFYRENKNFVIILNSVSIWGTTVIDKSTPISSIICINNSRIVNFKKIILLVSL